VQIKDDLPFPQFTPELMTRVVELGPEPRTTTLLFGDPVVLRTMGPLRVNIPEPSRTYWLFPHAATALLIVAGLPEYEAMVDPHCVHDPDGMPPETPTFDRCQLAARLGSMIPAQLWASERPEKQINIATIGKMTGCQRYIFTSAPPREFEACSL
jgi:hypothetical protein